MILTDLWRQATSLFKSFSVPPGAGQAASSLQLLVQLRCVAVVAQLGALFVDIAWLGRQGEARWVVVLISAQTALLVMTWLRLRHLGAPVRPAEVLLHAHLDIGLLATALCMSGGIDNPFALALLLPMVAAATLPGVGLLLTCVSTGVFLALLRNGALPIHGGAESVHPVHQPLATDPLPYLLVTVLLVCLLARALFVLRNHERRLARSVERQSREQAVLAIGTYAAGCVHELATPLATMTVLLKELRHDRGARQHLDDDLRVLDEQAAAARTILSRFSRMADLQRTQADGPVELHRFLAELVHSAQQRHPTATIQSAILLVPQPPHIVAHGWIGQALHVLVDNAVRASPQNVHIAAECDGARLRISVRDHGPGFPRQMLDTLGMVMFTSRPRGQGNGLGLVLTRLIADRLGGSLRLSCPDGGGARAELDLPLAAIGA